MSDGPYSSSKDQSYEPPSSWTGFYLDGSAVNRDDDRVRIGAAPGSLDAQFFVGNGPVPNSFPFTDPQFIGGDQLAFNRQIGSAILGIELDYMELQGGADKSVTVPASNNITTFVTSSERKGQRTPYGQGALGLGGDPRAFLYITGGFAKGDTSLTAWTNRAVLWLKP